ncbi:MAG TPA: hypothetical protein VGS07_02335 [Thermoanaerobaculia bacterium]|jgi:hypothetical protein|nr:hypothetical protein [Thermoanaerobaculia bacterium]
MTAEETYDQLIRRLKTLSERLWEGRCQAPDINAWLSNFDGRHCGDISSERLHALHLLASVSYFGLREIRVLLKSMFRDLYRYPIVQQLRRELGGTTDTDKIASCFTEELQATRFVGMGNPAESGTHLLYYFRQENSLPRSLFVHQHELLTSAATDPDADFSSSSLKRIVFIDDFCGSGEQAVRYSRTILRDLKAVSTRRSHPVQFCYLVLFGTSSGLASALHDSAFDVVDAVSELDTTYQTFADDSRVFRRPPDGIDITTSENLATEYGSELWPEWPLGYENGQLLIAFHHNIPDNSLPILWFDEGGTTWAPIFPRHPKID